MSWLRHFSDRFGAASGGVGLDSLFANAKPDSSLADRVEWAEDLLAWVRRDVPATRLRLLLQLLERQPDIRLRVASTLRSIVRDTEALDLFADTGLPRSAGFAHELFVLLTANLLPDPPDTRDLADIFDRLFPRASDSEWLEKLDPELAGRIVALVHDGEAPGETSWLSLRADMEDAMAQLADRVCVVGSHREVRARLGKVPFRELPFRRLTPAIEALLDRSRTGVAVAELGAELNQVRAVADACDRAMDKVMERLEKTGVSTSLVYDIERVRAQVSRLELLLEAWSAQDLDARRNLAILADLVRENHARRSVRELCRRNLHLLTRRIVERNAETGEHYVARSAREYAGMLRSAAGGGALTGATTVVKIFLATLGLAEFFKGAAFGLNYAVSFVAIQLLGFTLATKQPAATAPALARRMNELRDARNLEALVDEIVFLIRSQIASVFGNLALVIPATWLLDLCWTAFSGHHVVNGEKAEHILKSMAPLSGCWVFAVFTGVLLWFSSLIAAWMDNWFVLHELGPAIAQSRVLLRWFGPSPTRRLSAWLQHHISGLAGNISLGFLLGMSPIVATFFGLPLDVRHVTLASGQVTAAFAQLGGDRFWTSATLWTLFGVMGIGVLNIAVSFGLSLFVAIRARNVRGPELHLFHRALLKRMVKAPLSFVLPVGIEVSAAETPH